MFEINNHNGTWECWMGGRIFDWNDSLENLLKDLSKKAEDIEQEINE
jgi:hypothetical protein